MNFHGTPFAAPAPAGAVFVLPCTAPASSTSARFPSSSCDAPAGRRAWIRVVDNGPGIPPEVLGRLTREPVTTRAATGGSGMGLMFCQRVMQAISGAIEVQSVPGEGASVTLYFRALGEEGR